MKLSYDLKEHIHRIFGNAHLTADEYVMREWRAGRYSWAAIDEDIHASESLSTLGPRRKAFAVMVASSALYLYVCSELKSRQTTQSEFFRRVCFPLFMNP